MKTTIDLPDDLVRRLKLRALREGKKLKDMAADLLRNALAAPPAPKEPVQPLILKDKKTGLPVIQAPRPHSPTRQPTPDEIAEMLSQQDVEWAREAS